MVKAAAQVVIQNTGKGQRSKDRPTQHFDKDLERFCQLGPAGALPTNNFHKTVIMPSTLQHWYPQPQSQMQCSQTACPTRSTWLSSKPRFPVPKTFTLPCWTVPTRSLARLLHHQLALGAASEVLVGKKQRMKYGLRQTGGSCY